jgi:chemotaxis protein MotA
MVGVSIVLFSIAHVGGVASIGSFWSWSEMLLVFGGAITAMLISISMKDFLSVMKVTWKAFRYQSVSPTRIINDMVRYAEIARRDGILALESVTHEAHDPFLVKGIQLAVDGTDPELIDQILSTELEYLQSRHEKGRKTFQMLGMYAPAFGLVGTLIGLVLMLRDLSNPATLGKSMASALVATFYGVLLANLIFLPTADKLGGRSAEERFLKEIIIRGILSIQSGDNPRIVEQKLKIFLPPKERGEVQKK